MDRDEKDHVRRDPRDRERGERTVRTESEERRRRERRREKEERHRREKEKIRNGGKPTRKAQGLDIIDKLDVTGIYGPGCGLHPERDYGEQALTKEQYSTTTAPLTLAIPTATHAKTAAHPCKHFLLGAPTWHSAVRDPLIRAST